MGKDDFKNEDFVFTLAIVKDEYVKATKAIVKAKAMLRNAKSRKNAIVKAMRELGYDLDLIDEGVSL